MPKVKCRPYFEDLQNLKNGKITLFEIAETLINAGVSNQKDPKKLANSLSNRSYNDGYLKEEEFNVLEKKYKSNQNMIQMKQQEQVSYAAKVDVPDDIIEIPYWEELPENLKHPEYSFVLAQRTSIEQGWGLEAENLRIVPMVGDKMTHYWYPIFNRDILIIDISQNHISGNGVYFATSQNNTRFWIREMQVLVNNDVEFKGFAPSGNTTRVLTHRQLEDVNFKIIGKVIKNVSFRL